MNKILFPLLFTFLCLNMAFAQDGKQEVKKDLNTAPQSKIDPFRIETGRYFSVSNPKTAPTPLASEDSAEEKNGIVLQDFGDAMEVIRKYHVDGKRLDLNILTRSSIDAMLRTLDPHSNYYDAAEYQEMLSDQHSEYIGIGCSIANYTKRGVTDTYVTSTYPGSPASRAGLRFGDKIVAVDGVKMADRSSAYVRELIRGQKGTTVRLTVERNDSGKIEIVELKRNTVPQPSIPDAYLLRPKIGYINLSNGFNYTTIEEFNVALKELRDQGMTSLVLDLRDNPGGIVEQAVKVAEKFLPNGQVIVSQRGRFAIDGRVWKSTNRNVENIPLVVLVNEGTASASEIVSGALQDYDRALIIGEKTFGKGLVQSVIDLPHGSGLTLTTAKYYTPSGRSIQREYANKQLYDYFNHRTETENPLALKSSRTLTGRIVHGGNGIEPDEIVKNPELTEAQLAMIDSLFFFSAELTAGRIEGLESYKITKPIQYGQRIRPSDLPATDELYGAFKRYALKKGVNTANLEVNKAFIAQRIRFNMATSAFGNVAANQVLIENDPQVAKAIEALPRAQTLAQLARKNWMKQ